MARGYPSMTALLGLLAVVGYQNRDKIAEMLGSGRRSDATGVDPDGSPRRDPQTGGFGRDTETGGLGGLLGSLGGGLGGAGGAGGLLGGGLKDLIDRFREAGQGETVDSWVGRGPNRDIAPTELERAIGSDTLDELSRSTGLSRAEILSRLSRTLPEAVDRYTPEGRLDDAPDGFPASDRFPSPGPGRTAGS